MIHWTGFVRTALCPGDRNGVTPYFAFLPRMARCQSRARSLSSATAGLPRSISNRRNTARGMRDSPVQVGLASLLLLALLVDALALADHPVDCLPQPDTSACHKWKLTSGSTRRSSGTSRTPTGIRPSHTCLYSRPNENRKGPADQSSVPTG